MRIETDALGGKSLPEDALYGINTLRASENFDLGHRRVNPALLRALILVKKAAAITYQKLDVRSNVFHAIEVACNHALSDNMDDVFITEALQGGAGTSTNMNVNEVLANLAIKHLGGQPGDYRLVHPLDDVNRGQSTNDVYPTALRIAAIEKLRAVSEECARLQTALQQKENAWADIRKLGRTELMDAVPITLGEEFGAYAQAISRDRWRLYKVEERLRQVNLGGTAVGLSDGATRKYRFLVIEELRRITGLGLAAAEYPMDITQNQDVFVEVSGLLKAMAVNLMKISNDLRLMNSGPLGGLGELRFAPLQQGSTIMPGKVNPVAAEMAMQCALRVMGNDLTISMAASHGEFELNAFLPLIADALLESLTLLTGAARILRVRVIDTLSARQDVCQAHLDASCAFAASYVGLLGYDTVSRVIRDHPAEKARTILETLVSDNSTEKDGFERHSYQGES